MASQREHGTTLFKSEESTSTVNMARQCHMQGDSIFFSIIPQEIRDEIYSLVFLTTRLRRGKKYIDSKMVKFLPAPNSLAILQVCHRMTAEIGDSWIGQILFYYEDVRSMLDHLTVLPEIIPKIRHLRVPAGPLRIEQSAHDINYRLAPVLKLLPGLSLDTLTVLGCEAPEISYETLTGLIRDSSGWKELRYISHGSAILGFSRLILSMMRGNHDEMRKWWRRPQPSNWQSLLEKRDGADSQPLVTIYRSPMPYRLNSILRPKNRIVFTNPVPGTRQELGMFGMEEVAPMMRGVENHREMMIVARRRNGVDYTERPDLPLLRLDFRTEFPGLPWSRVGLPRHPSSQDPRRAPVSAHVDSYQDRDEFVWSYYNTKTIPYPIGIEKTEDCMQDMAQSEGPVGPPIDIGFQRIRHQPTSY